MGALDFLKDAQGKVIDAATDQFLRENNELLQDRVISLQDEIRQPKELRPTAPAELADAEFAELDGVLFKKQNGEFSDTPFCPNCKSLPGNSGVRIFV